jgi:hypothetical protein
VTARQMDYEDCDDGVNIRTTLPVRVQAIVD